MSAASKMVASQMILYGELVTGFRRAGKLLLRYKDGCKRDMKAGGIHPAGWEAVAEDRVI